MAMSLRSALPATVALLSALAVVACAEDSFGPGSTYPVQVERLWVDTSAIAVTGGFTSQTCGVTLVISTNARRRATWTRYIVRRFINPDLATLTHTDTVSAAASVQQGSRGWIRAGLPDTLVFGRTATTPIAIEVRLGYQVDGDGGERFTDAELLRCGPVVPAASPAPTITYLGLVGADSIFTLGDSIGVRYRVADGAALWQTLLRVSGPFTALRRVPELGAPFVERTEYFRVDRGILSGEPFAVRVEATDAVGRLVTLDTITNAAVVDTVPPQILSSNIGSAQWPTGIPLQFTVDARENNAPAWLIWELDGEISLRDSVMVVDANAQFNRQFAITAPDDWGGKAARLRIWLRDRAGLLSAPVESAADAYSFYVSTPAITQAFGTLPLDGPGGNSNIAEVLYDPARDRLYSANPETGRLTVASAATGAIISQLDLPPIPGSMALSRSNDSLFVTQSTEWGLSVVDLNTLTHLGDIAISLEDSVRAEAPGNPPYPNGVRVAANGKVFAMLHRTTANGHRIVEVDPATGTGVLRTDAGGFSGGINVWWRRSVSAPGGERIYFGDAGCPRFYVSGPDAFTACGPASLGEQESLRPSVDSASGRLLINGRLHDAQLAPLAELPSTVGALLPGGEYAVVGWTQGIAKMRVADGRVMRRLGLDFDGFPTRIVLTADGNAIVFNGTAFYRVDLTELQ